MEDMSRYLRMYLGRGQFEGKTILNAADIVEMTNPQMVIPDARRFEEISATQYGMGFFLTHYRGERLVHHGGNMPGASSLLSFIPQRNIGVFTTTNLSSSQLPSIVTYAIYDRLLGMKNIDWSARYWDIKEKGKASEENAKKQKLSPRKLGTKPAHQLSAYEGDYAHPGYGTINFSLTGDGLLGAYNGLVSLFPHYHYEVFEATENKLNDLSKTKAQFVTDVEGEVTSVLISMEPSVKPIEFVRQPDASFKDAGFLRQFVGEYELGANKVTVRLREDNNLTLAIPGQSTQELAGLRGNKFALKGLSGFTVEFIVDSMGRVSQLAFYQPNGNFVAVRKQ